MKNWLKNNWFQMVVIVLLGLILWQLILIRDYSWSSDSVLRGFRLDQNLLRLKN